MRALVRPARSLLLGLWLAWQTLVNAAPQINWGEMLSQNQVQDAKAGVALDLRQRWEATIVGSVKLANDQAFDPQQVWAWPAERFSAMPMTEPITLHAGERLVARMTIFSDQKPSDFSLTVMMPRLDAVHLSYRHDGGAWTTQSAGDTIAMNRWPMADRQPSFIATMPPGQMDVVMQFAHRGIVDTPVVLQNNRAFLASRTSSVWLAGVFLGINMVMALLGVLMALHFHKLGFVSVALMSTMVALVLMFGSGLGGTVVASESDQFNDKVKFIVNTVWGMLLPAVAAMAVGMHLHSRPWWWSSVGLSAAGVVMALVWVDYSLRDAAPFVIAAMLIVVLVYVCVMLSWAWLKNYCRNVGIILGFGCYLSALFLLFAGYVSIIDTDSSGTLAALISLLAALALLRGLFLQHRMGRQVLARARISPLRDVLTGLLNRDGMQVHLYKMRSRLHQQQTGAVFIYIPVQDATSAMHEHGEQGFEMGMVQAAASLSTSVTGSDGVSRISRHAFGIAVMMPPDPALAIRLAQKILSRLMALASHGAPLAGTARIALAWMPLSGFRIDQLEQSCLLTLALLHPSKRIGWVGGADSHAQAAQMLREDHPSQHKTSDADDLQARDSQSRKAFEASSTLNERIHRIEREMLHGVDTRFLIEEAERMSVVLNEAHANSVNLKASEFASEEAARDPASTLMLAPALPTKAL